MIMKDFLKQKLNVGDKVIFIEPGYRNYKTGVISRFTKHFAFVENKKLFGGEMKQKGHQLIKY